MSREIHTQVVRLVTADAILMLHKKHSVQCRKHIEYENSTQLYVSVVCQTLYLHVQRLYLEELVCTWARTCTTRQMNTCMRGHVVKSMQHYK